MCVGGRREAGVVCLDFILVPFSVLSSHCCGALFSLHFPEGSVGFSVGEVGVAVGGNYFLFSPDSRGSSCN